MFNMIKVFAAASLSTLATGQNAVFLNCDPASYYSLVGSPTVVKKSEMRNLIKTTHQNTVPYTSDEPDLWDALIDVDGYVSSGDKNIKLIYAPAEKVTSALPYDQGNCQYWNREHL